MGEARDADDLIACGGGELVLLPALGASEGCLTAERHGETGGCVWSYVRMTLSDWARASAAPAVTVAGSGPETQNARGEDVRPGGAGQSPKTREAGGALCA